MPGPECESAPGLADPAVNVRDLAIPDEPGVNNDELFNFEQFV